MDLHLATRRSDRLVVKNSIFGLIILLLIVVGGVILCADISDRLWLNPNQRHDPSIERNIERNQWHFPDR
jgi:hypothetical protein